MPKDERQRYPRGHSKAGQFKPVKDPEQIEKEEFLALALERFKLAAEAEARWRRDALEDFEFYIGEQWPVDIKTQRDRDRRPCLTINRLKPSKRIITNEYRQQRPAIQVNPEGDGATVESAQIMQGIVRHIEVGSDAEVGYDITFDNMVIGGLGWVELDTQYKKNAKTKRLEIRLRGAKNSFMHYADCTAEEFDYSDAEWHFKIHDFTRSEFKAKWPDAEAASLNDWGSVGDNAKDWISKDVVRVAEYWYMSDAPVPDEGADERTEQNADDIPDDDFPEKEPDEAEDQPRVCRKALITAVDKLEDKATVWDSIPNVPMTGEDLEINGRRYIAGMVRDAKDPQRQFNYWESKCTEAIALAPMSPFTGYAEVIENHEEQWKAANRTADAVLIGNAVVKEGQLLPLPVRETPNVDITGLAAMRQSAASNIEAVTGLNDATLGRMRPDESGKAVLARQKQGDITNLNYSDNAARTLRRVGRLLLSAIPKVYDVPTIMRIGNPDGTFAHVVTHLGADQKSAAEKLAKQNPAIKQIFDLDFGSYDVSISVGPSYQTKRQEAVASIMALIEAAPNVISIVGDLLVGNMDWNNAPEIAKRMKKMLPPQLQDEDGQADPAAQAQQAQAQLAALTQVHQQVVGALQQAQMIIQTKQVEQAGKATIEKMRIDADVLMTKMKALTPILVAEINTKAQDAQIRAQIDADLATELHSSAHELAMSQVVPAAQPQQQQADQRAQEAAAATSAASQNADQAHQLAMSQQAQNANQNQE
jgi:hypothetical protein